MAIDGGTIGWPGRIAVAVVREDPPRVLIAESDRVLTRVLALHVVAASEPGSLGEPYHLERIRKSLTEQRWNDAVVAWIEATGTAVDVYPDEVLWSDHDLPDDFADLELRLAPIFRRPEAER